MKSILIWVLGVIISIGAVLFYSFADYGIGALATAVIIADKMPYSLRKVSGKAEIAESKAECVIELNTGRILYESHGDLRLPMASTTISSKTDACINAPIPKKQARPNVISKKITIRAVA